MSATPSPVSGNKLPAPVKASVPPEDPLESEEPVPAPDVAVVVVDVVVVVVVVVLDTVRDTVFVAAIPGMPLP
jgi:hypothetical protein